MSASESLKAELNAREKSAKAEIDAMVECGELPPAAPAPPSTELAALVARISQCKLTVEMIGPDGHPNNGVGRMAREVRSAAVTLRQLDPGMPLVPPLPSNAADYFDTITDWCTSAGPAATDSEPPALPPANAAVSHSADFTTVRWYGKEYVFHNGAQAIAIRMLWAEFEKGHGLSQKTIGAAVDSATDGRYRLHNTFRGHPAWGTMIQACGSGVYRLAKAKPDSTNKHGWRDNRARRKRRRAT
jgi:hypothetical protein